jgi:hypothetical protein
MIRGIGPIVASKLVAPFWWGRVRRIEQVPERL